MSFDYIRANYNVPAFKGGRVLYTGSAPARYGTIVGSLGAFLRIRLDGDRRISSYHPTWKLEYIDTKGT